MATIKLYYAPKTRASRPRWLLEELGVSYELARLDLTKGDQRQPEYRAVHPLGAVPALADGEVTLFESAAICMYLADKFPEKRLAPALGTADRGRYYQWMVFAMVTLEPPIQAASKPDASEDTRRRVGEVLDVVEQALAGKEWMLGSFSAVDCVLGGVCAWAGVLRLIGDRKQLAAYYERIKQRPAFQRARAD